MAVDLLLLMKVHCVSGSIFPLICFVAGAQVLLVAGGWDTPNFSFINSVEILTEGASAWVFTTPLPRDMAYNQGVSIDNKLFMVGGGNRASNGLIQAYSDVMLWNAEESRWEKAGDMVQARSSHAVSSIEVTESLLAKCYSNSE